MQGDEGGSITAEASEVVETAGGGGGEQEEATGREAIRIKLERDGGSGSGLANSSGGIIGRGEH